MTVDSDVTRMLNVLAKKRNRSCSSTSGVVQHRRGGNIVASSSNSKNDNATLENHKECSSVLAKDRDTKPLDVF